MLASNGKTSRQLAGMYVDRLGHAGPWPLLDKLKYNIKKKNHRLDKFYNSNIFHSANLDEICMNHVEFMQYQEMTCGKILSA